MKITIPVLALIVAILLVASQSLYTVDQRQYAIKFQLGEIIETLPNAGPVRQGAAAAEREVLRQARAAARQPEPDRITTSEKKPLLVDFFVLWRITDVKQYYISVQGDEEGRAAPAVADGAREPRRRVQQAHGARGDLRRARQDHDHDAQKADADAKTIGVEIVDVRLRRVELPPDVTGPVYARMESERRRVANELRSLGQAESEKIRADADRQRVVILADAYKAAQKDEGRRRRARVVDLCHRVRRQSGVLRVLSQPRGVPRDVPHQDRHDGARPELGILPLLPEPGRRRAGEAVEIARRRAANESPGERRAGFAVGGLCAGAGRRGLPAFVAPRLWRESFTRLVALTDGQLRFVGLASMLIGLAGFWLVRHA
jgi:membrane protease subunit HflC